MILHANRGVLMDLLYDRCSQSAVHFKEPKPRPEKRRHADVDEGSVDASAPVASAPPQARTAFRNTFLHPKNGFIAAQTDGAAAQTKNQKRRHAKTKRMVRAVLVLFLSFLNFPRVSLRFLAWVTPCSG